MSSRKSVRAMPIVNSRDRANKRRTCIDLPPLTEPPQGSIEGMLHTRRQPDHEIALTEDISEPLRYVPPTYESPIRRYARGYTFHAEYGKRHRVAFMLPCGP